MYRYTPVDNILPAAECRPVREALGPCLRLAYVVKRAKRKTPVSLNTNGSGLRPTPFSQKRHRMTTDQLHDMAEATARLNIMAELKTTPAGTHPADLALRLHDDMPFDMFWQQLDQLETLRAIIVTRRENGKRMHAKLA